MNIKFRNWVHDEQEKAMRDKYAEYCEEQRERQHPVATFEEFLADFGYPSAEPVSVQSPRGSPL